MFALEETRHDLHLESLRNAVRRDTFVACLLPLLLVHPLTLALDVPYACICLEAMV